MADPTSATAVEFGAGGTPISEHLLYMILDQLRILVWQKTKDGSKNRNQPTPLSPLAAPVKAETLGDNSGLDNETIKSMLAGYGPAEEGSPDGNG